MSNEFTPGPWTFSEWGQFGETRFYVAQQEGAPYTHNFSDVATLIAETVVSERIAIQRANARLIAAAPDLLAVLTKIRGYHVNHHVLHEIDAAITKATGEAPKNDDSEVPA